MGSVLSPLLKQLDQFDELPFASTLCGTCRDICPVMIDLPRMLLELRKDIVERWRGTGTNIGLRAGMEIWSFLAGSRGGLDLASGTMRSLHPLVKKIAGEAAPELAPHRYTGK
jgi:L-lactate utilization protein LutB